MLTIKIKTATLILLAASSVFSIAGEITNKLGITMVDIPAGSFLMGSSMTGTCNATNDVGGCSFLEVEVREDEKPRHLRKIRKFQMGKTEVTVGQFRRFIAGAKRPDLLSADFLKLNANGDDAAVVLVSWKDAQDFIAWLNKVDGGGYRLPSEAEWEYACRAGSQYTYCGADNADEVAWTAENSDKHIHTVATKKPNAFGLYDMSGNAWEWVQDRFHPSYAGAPTTGEAWTSSGEPTRMQRGGSWNLDAGSARATLREHESPVDRYFDNGFRLARSR